MRYEVSLIRGDKEYSLYQGGSSKLALKVFNTVRTAAQEAAGKWESEQ